VTIEGFRRDIDSLWKNVEALKPLLNSDAKTARIAPLEELEWVTPARAAELFLPEFTQAIARGWGDVNECDQEMQNAADQHRRILSASPGKPLSEELKQAYIQENTRISHAQARRASAMREIDKLLFQRIEELRARLEAGQLLAQGFLMARTIGAPPTNIAKQEWRILDFDTTEADWSAVKTGSSRMYQGVRIAQPKPLQVD
jgi:exonuclease VII large subunit